MKKIFLLLLGSVWLLSCQSAHLQLPQSNTTTESLSTNVDGSVSTDTIPSLVNAAQTPVIETASTQNLYTKHTLAYKKSSVFYNRRFHGHLSHSLDDTTKIYTRRQPMDTRQVYGLSRVSLGTGIGAYVLLILSQVMVSQSNGLIGLFSLLLAVSALLTGIGSLVHIRRSSEQYRGRGRAIAGIILGSLFILGLLTLLIIALIALGLL